MKRIRKAAVLSILSVALTVPGIPASAASDRSNHNMPGPGVQYQLASWHDGDRDRHDRDRHDDRDRRDDRNVRDRDQGRYDNRRYDDGRYRNDYYNRDGYYRSGYYDGNHVGRSVAIVGGSAAAGALIGGAAGHGQGAAVGALVGGIAGFVADQAVRHHNR